MRFGHISICRPNEMINPTGYFYNVQIHYLRQCRQVVTGFQPSTSTPRDEYLFIQAQPPVAPARDSRDSQTVTNNEQNREKSATEEIPRRVGFRSPPASRRAGLGPLSQRL